MNNSLKSYLNQPEENDFFTRIPDDGVVNTVSQTLSPNKTFSLINNQENLYKTISMNNNAYDQFISNAINYNDIKSSLNAKSEPLPENEEEINENLNLNINKNTTYNTDNSKNIKTFSENNSKISKLTLLDNFLYGKEFMNPENNNKKNDFYNPKNQKGNIEINVEENIINKNSKMIKSVNSINLNDNSNYNLNIDDENKNDNNSILRRTTIKRRHRGAPEKTRVSINGKDDNGVDIIKEYDSYNDCTLNMPKDLKCGCTGNLDEGCFIF